MSRIELTCGKRGGRQGAAWEGGGLRGAQTEGRRKTRDARRAEERPGVNARLVAGPAAPNVGLLVEGAREMREEELDREDAHAEVGQPVEEQRRAPSGEAAQHARDQYDVQQEACHEGPDDALRQ